MSNDVPSPRTTDSSWDPTAYALFGDHRSRPFYDLLARVRHPDPLVVVDLGCGPGNLTLDLVRRWPQARVMGVDSSEEMLAQARANDRDAQVEWVHASAESLDAAGLASLQERAGGPIDVLFTNATLQWVPSHLLLIPTWLDALAPGGWFAMQVPSNFAAPSHALMREVARRHRAAARLRPALERADAVALPETYANLLLTHDRCVTTDVWQTSYLQVLPAPDGDEHPVLAWVRGAGLRPVLGLLADKQELEEFLTEYRAALADAYPTSNGRVLFPFTRTFAIAQVD